MKKHFEENKKFYIGIACGVALAGITWLIVREKTVKALVAQYPMQSPGDTSGFSFLQQNNSGTIRNVIVHERVGRGHPGYQIHCRETNLVWSSQKQAALANDVTVKEMSDHINGRLPDINGLHFERVVMAA
jgi:hypothetical protein